MIEFWTDPTATDDATVWLLVTDAANGYSWEGPIGYGTDHAIIIDEIPGIQHQLAIPFGGTQTYGAATDLTVDLRPDVVV